MNFTSFYIEKLKISNFLSFFDIQEVYMERFTAIICNYSEGKRDLLRALEFVFGASPKEIQADSLKQLLQRALWEEFENENAVECFVEVSLSLLPEKETVKFYRGVKNSGLEHKIDDKLVSNLNYEEKLNTLGLCVNLKNIIFRKNLYYEIIWGNSEDLEKTVTKILRASSNVDEWKKTKDRMKYVQETKKILAHKNLQKMKKCHGIIETFVDTFHAIAMKRDCFQQSLNLEQILEEDSSFSVSSGSKTEISEETMHEILLQDKIALEEEQESLFEKYRSLEKKEKQLHGELFFNEVKISTKSANSSILRERIVKLKAGLRALENSLPSLWTKIEKADTELNDVGNKISDDLAYLWDLEQSFYLKNRFTTYGRFIDYLKQSSFVNVLRKILGEEIIYGNLCDDMQTAIFYSNLLKEMKYKRREHFLIFKNYSAKLKDLLLASGEEGIRINNIEELQILLCKFKQYGLISAVPIIIRRSFNFKLIEGKNYDEDIMYPLDGIFLKSDGLIIYTSDQQINFETEESLLQRVNSLLIQQAAKYEEYRHLIFTRLETLRNMMDLENDILHLKFELGKHTPKSFVEIPKIQISSVYDTYASLFKEHDQQMEDVQRQIKESEYYLGIGQGQQSLMLTDDGENSHAESLLTSMSTALDEIQSDKMKTKIELSELEKKLRILDFTANEVPIQPALKFLRFKQQKMNTQFYYETELENLKLLMSKNEMEEFEGWKDWRKEIIKSLLQDTATTDDSLKELKADLERLTTSRKRVLSPFLEHCSHHLTSTLNLMMDMSLPFLDLTMNQSEDGLQLLTSLPENLVNFIEIGNLNTFLKFIAALSLFLEMAVYDKIPILILDDMEEFLPGHKANFESVICENALKRLVDSKGNTRFQILMRVMQFFEFFIKKNTAVSNVRKNGNKTGTSGPAQVIYFTDGDLVHFAQHHLWIQSKFLPDGYITNDCDSYSLLQEIHFK